MKDLRGKRALITGAGSGIGRAIALALAREGVRLFLVDVNEESLDAAASEARALGAEVLARRCDVAEASDITAAVAALLAAWDGLEILVNNAGIVYYGSTHDMSAEQWERMLAVNLLAPVRFIHALLPTLRRADEAQILNVSSIMGLVPKRHNAAYQTTKFGLVGLSLSLRAEYNPSGVGVGVLCPGMVKTQLLTAAGERGMLTKKPKVPGSWYVSPRYVGKHAVKAIRQNKAITIIPWHARVYWWFYRAFPWLTDVSNQWTKGKAARARRLKEGLSAED